MLQRTLLLCAVTALAPSAFAQPANESNPLRNYVVSGEILVYSPRVSGLAESTVVAPRGARTDSELLLRVTSQSSASDDLSRFDSGPLASGRAALVMGEGSANPLEIGELSLHVQDGLWTFFGSQGELAARPIFVIAPDSASIKRLSELEFTISGELVLDESMAAELGLIAPPHSLIVGATTLHASSYPGLFSTPPSVAPRTALVTASSALSVAGPDVVVSTIGGSLTEYGVVGTIGAWAVTTVSCNIGTQDAIWIDCTTGGASCNQHPVIGTQFYRLKTVAGATRFEQIGMSWLKHGFCAADAPNCGTPYTPNGSCDWLGLFATDTYGSGLNASQTGCGPRSEINPWTGLYPYPYQLNWGVTGNAIWKRCQIETADLDPAQNAGAQYLCDVVYICTDEPEANRYNNYSNRAVTVGALTGSQYNLEFTGSTIWQQSAFERWPILDPGVTIVPVDVPGDGRFYVGAKVTDLGGNLWHYEYAVFNMNCHDSAQRITVPVDVSVNVNGGSIGFHDVPYHSGEPYDGTDWPGVRNSSNVEWATSPFFTNANANALRWSTTYNFRFDANVGPTVGDIEIGLFRSGGIATAVGLPVPDKLWIPYCFGDGTGSACPCGNAGAAGNGCAHSLNPAGANLVGAGIARISADTFSVTTTGMPNGPGLYFQGSAPLAGGAGGPFGDGLLCAGGAIIRLGVKFSTAGASTFPSGADPLISVAGGAIAGATHYYQQWFRDAGSFCTPSTFNLTNGVSVTWVP
ncbi:MAG: hypothetical protein JNL28_11125 [Planctomycetes bacterium]|nr:hypothetical protein [Planctomycetota bacterium]